MSESSEISSESPTPVASGELLGRWCFARYGSEIVIGQCVAADASGMVLRFRWGGIFRGLHYVEKRQIISEAQDPRWFAKIRRLFGARESKLNPERPRLAPLIFSKTSLFPLVPAHFKLWTCDDGYGCEIYTAPEKGGELLARCFNANLDAVTERAVTLAICDHEFDAEDLPCAYCGATPQELGLSPSEKLTDAGTIC